VVGLRLGLPIEHGLLGRRVQRRRGKDLPEVFHEAGSVLDCHQDALLHFRSWPGLSPRRAPHGAPQERAAPEAIPALANKFIKLLGMLSSEHAGERANAIAAAERLRKQYCITWRDIVRPAITKPA